MECARFAGALFCILGGIKDEKTAFVAYVSDYRIHSRGL